MAASVSPGWEPEEPEELEDEEDELPLLSEPSATEVASAAALGGSEALAELRLAAPASAEASAEALAEALAEASGGPGGATAGASFALLLVELLAVLKLSEL